MGRVNDGLVEAVKSGSGDIGNGIDESDYEVEKENKLELALENSHYRECLWQRS